MRKVSRFYSEVNTDFKNIFSSNFNKINLILNHMKFILFPPLSL